MYAIVPADFFLTAVQFPFLTRMLRRNDVTSQVVYFADLESRFEHALLRLHYQNKSAMELKLQLSPVFMPIFVARHPSYKP